MQDTLQVADDAQVRANDYIVPAGEILIELGLDCDRILALKAAGAVT